ncbi:MAG: hypothetical protein NC911_01810 [Candidatus Omnitrophica bacterium]|nr:hypothetical protein [Candidatus Omnitrophota bacterium]
MARRKKRKKRELIFLVGLAALSFFLWKYFGSQKMVAAGGNSLYTVIGHVAVTHSSDSALAGNHLLENLVTFLNPGDEFRILEVTGSAVRVLITRHNNFPTELVGWIPADFLKKFVQVKKENQNKL